MTFMYLYWFIINWIKKLPKKTIKIIKTNSHYTHWFKPTLAFKYIKGQCGAVGSVWLVIGGYLSDVSSSPIKDTLVSLSKKLYPGTDSSVIYIRKTIKLK